MHLVVLAFTLGNGGRGGLRPRAEIVLGGCEPVDDGGAPRDCRGGKDVSAGMLRGEGKNVLSMVQMVKQSQPFS